jgi:hypothetical protein
MIFVIRMSVNCLAKTFWTGYNVTALDGGARWSSGQCAQHRES